MEKEKERNLKFLSKPIIILILLTASHFSGGELPHPELPRESLSSAETLY